MTESTEEFKNLKKHVEDIALRGASKEDIAKLEKLINEGKSSAKPPAKQPAATTLTKEDLEELKKYRENERQTILGNIPEAVIEEFGLKDKPLSEVRRINKLHKALSKKNVGIETPPVDSGTKQKKFQWNPETGKNEWC